MPTTLKDRINKDKKKMKYTTLPEITERVMQARANGTPEKVITGFLRKRGYTPASFEKAVDKQRQVETNKNLGLGFKQIFDKDSTLNKAGENLISGATGGLSIYARGLGRWAGSNMPWKDDSESMTWDESLEHERARTKQFEEENPNLAMGTEMAGIMGTAPAVVKNVVQKVPSLMPVAGQNVRNVLKGGTLHGMAGMAEGGSLAAAKGDNPAIGMGLGVLGGVGGDLAVPVAKYVTKKLTTPVREWLSKKTSKVKPPGEGLSKAEIQGEQAIEEINLKDGNTYMMREQLLDDYVNHGLGDEVMMLDLMKKKGKNLAGTVMRYGDKLPSEVEEKLVKRANNVRQRLFDFLQDATGGTRKSLKESADKHRAETKLISNKVYDTAFYEEGTKIFRTVADPRLNELFKLPEFKQAYKNAIKLAKHDHPGSVILDAIPTKEIELPNGKKKIVETGFPEGHEFPIYALDKVKKALNAKFGSNAILHPNANIRAMSSSMNRHKNDMLDVIEEYNGDYKRARDVYAGSMELKEASEMGQKLFDSEDAFDKIYEHSTKLKTESEKKAFQDAAFNTLSKKIEDSSVNPKGMAQFFWNPQNKRKLELLIPDEVKRNRFIRQTELLGGFVDIKNITLAGSQTAEKLASDAAEEELGQGIRFAANVANRNPAGVAQQLTEIGGGARRAAKLDVAGEKLATQGARKNRGNVVTGPIAKSMEESDFTNKLLKNKMRSGLLQRSAAGAGGTSLLNSLLQ